MTRYLSFILVLIAVSFSTGAHARTVVPKSIAGVSLGDSIAQHGKELDMKTALPMWNDEHLSRVEFDHLPGYRSGYVSYGNCKRDGVIMRIKLAYKDRSLGFFNSLLKAMKSKFGDNPEWRGDAFGTLRSWKWGMTDSEGNSISLILQHYEGDDDTYDRGNSIRLANRTWIAEERACFKEKAKESEKSHKAPEMKHSIDWFIPQ